jgi:hypothetical protein
MKHGPEQTASLIQTDVSSDDERNSTFWRESTWAMPVLGSLKWSSEIKLLTVPPFGAECHAD